MEQIQAGKSTVRQKARHELGRDIMIYEYCDGKACKRPNAEATALKGQHVACNTVRTAAMSMSGYFHGNGEAA
jgi:hypothetical protein